MFAERCTVVHKVVNVPSFCSGKEWKEFWLRQLQSQTTVCHCSGTSPYLACATQAPLCCEDPAGKCCNNASNDDACGAQFGGKAIHGFCCDKV
jgi:hypothetical protein